MSLEALQDLKEHVLAVLSQEAVEADIVRGELCVTVGRETVVKVLTRLRDDPNCAFTCLVDLCGVDWPARERRFDVVHAEGPDGGLDPMTARVTILNSESIELDSLGDVKAALGRAKRASVKLDVEIGLGFAAAPYWRAGFGTLQAVSFGSEGASA